MYVLPSSIHVKVNFSFYVNNFSKRITIARNLQVEKLLRMSELIKIFLQNITKNSSTYIEKWFKHGHEIVRSSSGESLVQFCR